MAIRSALMSLLSSKRSRLLTVLVCATFVLICISRLNEPSALLFGRPRASTPAQAPVTYNGQRFEIFGIPDFAETVEVATLNIKTAKPKPNKADNKVDKPILSPPSSGSPGLSHSHTMSEQDSDSSSDLTARAVSSSNSLAALQHTLPIALPKFHPHRLDSPDFNITSLENPPPGVPPATISLDLPPPAAQPDASSLIFGVATTLGRMPDTLRNFRHWAAHTGARFVVLHEPYNTTLRPGEPTPEEVVAMYDEAGITEMDLVERDAGWGERFVGLLGELHARLDPNETQWAVLIDDDTFFFDLNVVLARLKKYDHREDWYVGALSDNKWNVNNGGLYAVGGAGVFLSTGMLETMAPYAAECFPKGKAAAADLPGGDVLVGECIHRHTTTKLTRELGLFQLDLHGDVTGFYEAVRAQPVSVHHWKSWHHHDLPTIAAVAHKCGRACVLQNFRFQDGWQMSNGFSIVRYGYNETELAGQHPLAMEQTWEKTVWTVEDSWRYSLAPLKGRDGAKVQFLNEKTVVGEDGSVTVFYVRREAGVGKGLVRVVWR